MEEEGDMKQCFLMKEKTEKHLTYLVYLQAMTLLPEASFDNPVQICPAHVTHDRVPIHLR